MLASVEGRGSGERKKEGPPHNSYIFLATLFLIIYLVYSCRSIKHPCASSPSPSPRPPQCSGDGGGGDHGDGSGTASVGPHPERDPPPPRRRKDHP